MRCPRLLGVGLVLGVAAMLPIAHGQGGGQMQKVRFSTIDGVELVGTFYAGAKKGPPTVLLLHAIGEDSKKKGMVALAEELQKRGFAVLSFDFRGHGASTDLSDANEFWKYKINQTLFKGFPKAAIELKDK